MNYENTSATSDSSSPAMGQRSEAEPKAATVVVRGEMVDNQQSGGSAQNSQSQKGPQSKNSTSTDAKSKDKEKSPPKAIAETKAKMQSRLPALDDNADVGIEKEQIVTRDGKADLAFKGTLLASAAPSASPKGTWQEYRVYRTNGGKHVFSKVTRTIYAEDQDKYDAEVFDDSPSSMPSQLLRSARDLTRSRPLAWTDAAAAYFGYDPLAKALYRKLSGQFEEHIS